MIDVSLLRVMKHKSEFKKLYPIVAAIRGVIDPKTDTILTAFKKYFEKFPEQDRIDAALFVPQFKKWNSGMDEEVFNSYVPVFRNMMVDFDDATRKSLEGDIYELELQANTENIMHLHKQGSLTLELNAALTAAMDRYKLNMGVQKLAWDDTPIEDLLQEDLDESGLRWRLSCLNMATRPLRPGDFGIIAGRPDKGKTTFLTSEVTFLVPQLPAEQNGLWLNNEGPSGRIVKRLWQSTLAMTISEMVEASEKGTLRDLYKATMGRLDRIKVVNVHNMNVGQVDAIIDAANAGIIVYDMIDKIKGFDMSGGRTDERLEEMYDWGRNTAVKYNSIGFASSQISNEGDGMQFPTLGMLKDSKTGKQGACDFQIMIGASNDEGLGGYRFIGMPKNKIKREGNPGDPKATVIFDGERARYSMESEAA